MEITEPVLFAQAILLGFISAMICVLTVQRMKYALDNLGEEKIYDINLVLTFLVITAVCGIIIGKSLELSLKTFSYTRATPLIFTIMVIVSLIIAWVICTRRVINTFLKKIFKQIWGL